MNAFERICNHLTNTRPPVENVDNPFQDFSQQALLDYVEQRQPLPAISTYEDFVEVFGDDAPLIAKMYYSTSVDWYRNRRGQARYSPNKSKLLEDVFSLDGFDDKGEPWSEIIEDSQAELPFRHIEELDLVVGDERFKLLPVTHQDAIKRFIVAWFLVDCGYTLPNKVLKQIGRDRKLTGLPLLLPKGPKTGGKK